MSRSVRSPVAAFAASEGGAVTVDYVVLVSGAAMLAAGLAAAYTNQVLQLNYNVAANMQQRETRPSFAYRPYDPEVHGIFATLLSTLTEGELQQMSGWGNAVRGDPPQTDAEAERFRDLDNAITAVYASRYASRGEGADYHPAAVEGIAAKLGLAGGASQD